MNRVWVLASLSSETQGAIHSTKISGNFGPKLNGSVRSNRKSFEKTGSPFEVDHFSRSDRLEFWLNGSRPQGQSVWREKRRDESFQAQAEKPLGTDSHRTISKRSSECWLLIGHNNTKHFFSQSGANIRKLARPFGNGPVRVGTQGLFRLCLKTFVAPFLPPD